MMKNGNAYVFEVAHDGDVVVAGTRSVYHDFVVSILQKHGIFGNNGEFTKWSSTDMDSCDGMVIIDKSYKSLSDEIVSAMNDNVEKYLEWGRIPLWPFVESFKKLEKYKNFKNRLNRVLLFGVDEFIENSVTRKGLIVEAFRSVSLRYVGLHPNYLLYYNAITNKTYSDTIRRVFKFYGKECIWSYLQGCKIPDEYKATVAEIVSQVMDVFDNSERPDEWKPKMQSLLIETIQECLVIANKYITDNDDDLLESRLENFIKTAAKKYVELDKDDVVEETQQQSSSSEDKSQVIDAPQIGYDEEFNSTPKYDDLKAYDAFIKQQQQEIVESYLKGREERMKQNKTIDTVATVDNNGKITYNAKNISPLQLYMLDKVFYNKNITNILKQKINSPSFSLILIYNDTVDDYKVLCFNDKNELLFHYIKNENIIYFSEENYR